MKKIIGRQAANVGKATFISFVYCLYFLNSVSAQEDWGIKYKVQNDTSKKIIVVTFDATNAKSNVYFEDVTCKILYLDRNMAEIGSGEINFTGQSPKTLWGQKKYVRTFLLDYPNAFIAKGAEVNCVGNVSGGKADGQLPPAVSIKKKNASDESTFVNTDSKSAVRKTVILGRAKLMATSSQ